MNHFLEFCSDFWQFIREHRNYWLIPLLLVLVLTGLLIVLAKGSAVAPFIYTFF